MIQIKTIKQLKEACMDESQDFFIQFNGGVRSSKTIEFHSDEEIFEIFNFIDDTEQELTEKELFTESNIGKAITKGAMYLI